MKNDWSPVLPPRRRRVVHAVLLGLSIAAGAASCELVNSFPDLTQPDVGGGGATSSASSGPTSTSSSTSTNTGGSGTGTSSTGTSSTGTSGAGGSDAGIHGIIAVAGRVVVSGVKTSKRVFAVLDAATGAQLSRYDDLSIVAAVHDPATGLWYLFEAETLPPPSNKPITLHVGTIDPTNGRWEDGPAPVMNVPVVADGIDVGVLNRRLVYAAFDPSYDAGGVPPIGVAVLNTETPDAGVGAAPFGNEGFVSLASAAPDGGPVAFNGFIATPKAANQGEGGQANLITEVCPTTGSCTLTRYLLSLAEDPSIAPNPNPDLGTLVPKAANGIAAAWGSLGSVDGALDVIVYPPPPPVDGGTPGVATIDTFSPTLSQQPSTPIATFGLTEVTGGEQFTGLAYADCLNVLLLAERNDERLYAVPLTPQPGQPVAIAAQIAVGQTTSIIYFDPVTSNVFMPLQPAGSTFALEAWHLDGTMMTPKLTPLTTTAMWNPPSDLAVDVVAVRRPPGFTCPTGG